jgi:hypothetical protein
MIAAKGERDSESQQFSKLTKLHGSAIVIDHRIYIIPSSIQSKSLHEKVRPPMPFSDLFKKSPKKEPASAKPAGPVEKKNDEFSNLLKNIALNSTDGSGTRLVLGEGMAPMSEAMQNGGKYILVHPEVIKKLEENGIDAFLIYEAALKMELASKIPQIDFISGNVASLMQQAQGKPERQVPIHIRQLLWLRENAGNYGYQQNGNSWILK